MNETMTKVSMVINFPDETSCTFSDFDLEATNAQMLAAAKAINSLQNVAYKTINKVAIYRIGS